jgi:23S rRNA pseudouridine1911/1915/1917 synthase
VHFVVPASEARARLDQFVARHAGCSRAEARRLIDEGHVRVNGRRAAKGLLLQSGAQVELAVAPPTDEEKRPLPEPERPLVVLHADDALVALSKPAGIPTHPLRRGERGTLANALVARFPECAGVADDPREGGVAHRLDVDTSGVVLAARTREAWQALRRAFATGQVEKEYWALVAGAPPDAGEIDAALAHATARTVKAIEAGEEWLNQSYADGPAARPARTRFEVMARGPDVALVRALTRTGRMHQVRAHLAHLGHPLLGDALYGGPPAPGGAAGHVLHAARITFPHPLTGVSTRIAAPLPDDRARAIRASVGDLPMV